MLTKHKARYARQVALPQIGWCGQEKLAAATVVIVGCGGLGTVSAELLARAGVGHLRLVDDDRVEPANLIGQTLYDEGDAQAGQLKVVAASRNPAVHVEPMATRLTNRNADRLFAGADLVLDGTDNDATRYVINSACLRGDIPWIFGAVLESYGLTMNVVPRKTPCFVCTFGPPPYHSGRNGRGARCLAAATHVVASFQVSQALRLLLDGKYGRGLVYVDAWAPALERIGVKSPSAGCPACGRRSGQVHVPLTPGRKEVIIKAAQAEPLRCSP
jgi:molybdopterin/thiamine biosynthesis adenylyltransferase